jgi:hypothetical protein
MFKAEFFMKYLIFVSNYGDRCIIPEIIPTCNDHNPLAHLRCPMVIMRQG